MVKKICWLTPLVVPGLVACASPASAQGLATVGSRAAALAAFVAVADDASAVVWNPAGLVSGPIFNLQIDLARTTKKPSDPLSEDDIGVTGTATLISLGTTPVGLAYYRLATTSLTVADPAVGGSPDRQHRRVSGHTLVTSHLGATVQQSLGDYLTLGATIKVVRGSVGTTTFEATSWEEAFAQAENVIRQGSTRGDFDMGAMFAARQIKAGIVVRNITAPSFGEEDRGPRATLARHVRLGAAWGDRWPGLSQTVIAVDADATRVAHRSGERRDVAAGVERWMRGRRVGVRGGVRASTVGESRPVWSAGGSYVVRAGIYVDAFVARGTRDERAWGLAARVSY